MALGDHFGDLIRHGDHARAAHHRAVPEPLEDILLAMALVPGGDQRHAGRARHDKTGPRRCTSVRMNHIAPLAAHNASQRECGARDEDRIEVGDIEPDEVGARIGNFVLQPAAIRRDDHLMAGAAQDAHEIERARIRGPRMQRRRKHQHGQRPREHDDLANDLWRCDRNFDIRVRVERTARKSSRIQDRPHRPGATAHPESVATSDVIYRPRSWLDSPEQSASAIRLVALLAVSLRRHDRTHFAQNASAAPFEQVRIKIERRCCRSRRREELIGKAARAGSDGAVG